jgi:pilus assembly protein Flp/PilA
MESYMKTLLKNLIRDEQGQDVIEYALLAAAISIAVVPTVPGLGTAVNAIYVRVQAALP